LYPIRSKLRTYIDLIRILKCKDLDELEKYSEFINYLKTCLNPMDQFDSPELLNQLLKTNYDIDIGDGTILEWIKQWAELYSDYSTRSVANELLQRVLKEKNLTYGNSKINLLDKLINPEKFNPNNNTNFHDITTCELIFLIGSVIIIFQDKIKFEMGLTGSSSYLDTYKSILSKFLVDESLLKFLDHLLSSPDTVVLGGGAKRGSNGDEDDENDNTPALIDDSKIKEKPSKKQVPFNLKLQSILDLIKSRRSELQKEIDSNSDFNTKIAEYVVEQIDNEDDEFKKKLQSFLVIPSDGKPKVTDELYQEVKKFQNYASNKYYTMSMFDSQYKIDSNPELQLYCYGTIGNNTQFHKLDSSKITEFHPDFSPEQFKTSFDNWYFDVPLSGGNLPHNATVFTISVIYALEMTYTTVDEQDLKGVKPLSSDDVQGDGATKKKICILFTVSSTIVLPLPIPVTVTQSDIKFAIQNQITPIACIIYTDDDNINDLNINNIEKTLLGTYPRFAIYGSVFAGKPMDYVIGRHAQVPPYFKTDPFFSKYLKVCEHYCTTAPFYNWCKHKPYDGLVIGDGLPFARYFTELFSPTGQYANLQVNFNLDPSTLESILISRTDMVEKITNLFTLGCKFFEIDNSEDEKSKRQKEDIDLCKKASQTNNLCKKPTPQESLVVQDAILDVQRKRTRPSTAATATSTVPDEDAAVTSTVPDEDAAATSNTPDQDHASAMDETEGGSTSRQRQTFKRRQQGGNRTFKRHPRDKHKRKHNDDGLTKHKTSNKLRRKKSVKN
jgi:hypothetical protein